MRYLILLIIMIVFTACSSKPEIVKIPKTEIVKIPEHKGYSVVSKELAVFRGKLSSTKGNQAVIFDMIIDNDFIKEKDSKSWKIKYKAMLNKNIEVKGRLTTYHCGSREQCMTGGIIKYLKDIEYLTFVKKTQKRPMKKPILYLYPQKDIEVSVKLKYSENIIHSYPKYSKNGWNIEVKKDGTIIHNNKKYYSLFWEMLDYGDFKFNEGFIVKRSEIISFLESSLSTLGLNYKESQEFIIFWLPILEKNELTLIKFETSEYNKKQPIEILPKPDTLIRIMMVYKKINAVDILIKEQILPKNKRIGFTAVEWGGMEVR